MLVYQFPKLLIDLTTDFTLHIYHNKKISCWHLLIRPSTWLGTLFPANNYPVTKVLFQLQPLCECLCQLLWMEVCNIYSSILYNYILSAYPALTQTTGECP